MLMGGLATETGCIPSIPSASIYPGTDLGYYKLPAEPQPKGAVLSIDHVCKSHSVYRPRYGLALTGDRRETNHRTILERPDSFIRLRLRRHEHRVLQLRQKPSADPSRPTSRHKHKPWQRF